MRQIALLRASHSKASTRNFRREMPAHIETVSMHDTSFRASGFAPQTYDGIVITGSSSSVLDGDEWIDEARATVRTAVEEHDLPTLGVCWGAQLLADALGGTVERGTKRELGFRTVERTDNTHPAFHGIEDEFTAFQSHTDYVTQIPDNAELLARTDDSKQAFSYKSSLGVQFHPEVDYRTTTELVDTYKETDTVPAEQDNSVHSWALAEEAGDVLRNFVYEQL